MPGGSCHSLYKMQGQARLLVVADQADQHSDLSCQQSPVSTWVTAGASAEPGDLLLILDLALAHPRYPGASVSPFAC